MFDATAHPFTVKMFITMRTTIFSLLLALLFCQASTASAQTAAAEPTRYTAFGYHKVAPGMNDDFLKLAKAWKKIVALKKKNGLQESWSVAKVAMTGAASEYNYVTRHSFVGEVQLANYMEKPFLPDGWMAVLTPEEVVLVNRAAEIRTFVRQDIYSQVDAVWADDIDKATVAVFNFFKQPEGKTLADHRKMEQEIWKPVHAARVKDGKMKGWILFGLEFPFGSAQPYDMVTVDVYSDMKQMLAPWFDDYFSKIHAGKNVDDLLKRTNESTDLVRGEVRITIDRLEW